MLDAVIIGGSVAGLSAALVLGRSRRRVVVLDTGKPCNHFTHASHGFFTRDGIEPAELAAVGREQLAAYPSVELRAVEAVGVSPVRGGFEVRLADGEALTARKVLLAYGLRDALPAVDGIEALWGKSVFHCPYCDGWEIRDQPVAIYGNSDAALHQTWLLRNLTADLVLCTGGAASPAVEAARERLAKYGVRIIETPIAHVKSSGSQLEAIVFADGAALPRRAIFVRPDSSHSAPFAHDLGCAIAEAGFIEVDRLGQTSTAGVYAAGDIANPFRSVAVASAGGSTAAAGINHALVTEDFA